MAPTEFLEGLTNQHPELATDLSDLAGLWDRKLWHQLTKKLETIVNKQSFKTGDVLVKIYNEFISDFEMKLNLLKLAQIVVIISHQFPSSGSATEFLESLVVKLLDQKAPRKEEPVLYLRMHIALMKLQSGDVAACKEAIQAGKVSLDGLVDADPSVHAAVYHVTSLYQKIRQDFAEFYKTGMLYLAYISADALDETTRLGLAVDLSLAALLGDNIYNFGELLAHPVVKTLEESQPNYWLYELLVTFNNGDLHKYDELCNAYAAQMNAQPALVASVQKLREKITILCLMEIIFKLPADNRVISLDLIAERTKLARDDVEFLLMKTLSVHLIEGIIDQVDGTVHVSWVQPRIIGMKQISSLRDRLDEWIGKVHGTLVGLEADTPELLAQA